VEFLGTKTLLETRRLQHQAARSNRGFKPRD